jgi:hypothetical protein
LALLAREGSPAPGAGSSVFSQFGLPRLNRAGETAFLASLSGPAVSADNDAGVWYGLPGEVRLVAREGDQAPGTPLGVTFAEFDPSSPAVNAGGQIAFQARLTGAGVNSSNNRGIWATDRVGQLKLIVRTGDQLEIAPGDSSTVSGLSFVGHGDDEGGPKSLNDHGELAFLALFTSSRSGAYVSSLVARQSGDFNQSNDVDGADLSLWKSSFGAAGSNLAADEDRNRYVDGADFLAWQRSLGSGTPLVVAPEPSAAMLAAIATSFLTSHTIDWRRRRAVRIASLRRPSTPL